LRKEDPLSGAELLVLQRHPEIGFQMIEEPSAWERPPTGFDITTSAGTDGAIRRG